MSSCLGFGLIAKTFNPIYYQHIILVTCFKFLNHLVFMSDDLTRFHLVLRLRRSWLLFRRSALTESNTCQTARSAKSTPLTWKAFEWVSITWVLWTTLKMTTDETLTLHHPPTHPLLQNKSADFATDRPSAPLGWRLHRPYVFGAAYSGHVMG